MLIVLRVKIVDVFQHTATRRWLRRYDRLSILLRGFVSTHSHPKVAAFNVFIGDNRIYCFNTQPPEGGCNNVMLIFTIKTVSTHSHPKVAAGSTS